MKAVNISKIYAPIHHEQFLISIVDKKALLWLFYFQDTQVSTIYHNKKKAVCHRKMWKLRLVSNFKLLKQVLKSTLKSGLRLPIRRLSFTCKILRPINMAVFWVYLSMHHTRINV